MAKRNLLRSILLMQSVCLILPVCPAEFSFFATLRAGRPAAADWEIGLGTDRNASQATRNFQWESGTPTWRSDNRPQPFRLEYTASTQTVRMTVRDSEDNPWSQTITNSGPALGANAIWTLPAAGFFVSTAAPSGAQARSITVSNLTVDPGVQILSGSLPTSLAASGPPASSMAMSAPLVINAASNGGNWFLAGNTRFTGLTGLGGNAQGSQLQFFLNAIGTDTPEAQTFFLVGLGLLAVGFGSRRRSRE
jgi:hypothetical protein